MSTQGWTTLPVFEKFIPHSDFVSTPFSPTALVKTYRQEGHIPQLPSRSRFFSPCLQGFLILVLLFSLTSCGVGSGDNASSGMSTVAVTVSIPTGSTAAISPPHPLLELYAALKDLVIPSAWAQATSAPSFVKSLTISASADGSTLASTTVNVSSGQTATVTLEISAGSGRVITAKAFDGISGTGTLRFQASSAPTDLTQGTALSITLTMEKASSTNALSGLRAYVVNEFGGTVSVVDTTTNTVVATVTVGTDPFFVAITPDGTKAYVTNDQSVSVIDTSNNTVVATITSSVDDAVGIAITPDGTKAFVANAGNKKVLIIGTTTNTVDNTVPVGDSPYGVAISPDGARAYVTDHGSDTVTVIDTSTLTVVVVISVGQLPAGVVVLPNGNRVYVANTGSGTVSVIDPSSNTVTTTISVGTQPTGLTVSPDSTKLFVRNASTVSVIDTNTNTVTATVTVGLAGTSGFSDVALTPDGTRLYVTNPDANTVPVLNTSTNTVVATVNVGNGPYGVAIIP